MAYSYDHPRPSVTVDGLVFRLIAGDPEILLIKRKKDPYKHQWALPGGFMEIDETPEAGVRREVQEETGLRLKSVMQLGAYGAVNRDPRGRTVSIAYIAFVGNKEQATAADDAAEVKWIKLNGLSSENLAFDHALILQNAIALLKGQTIQEKLAGELGLEKDAIENIMRYFRIV